MPIAADADVAPTPIPEAKLQAQLDATARVLPSQPAEPQPDIIGHPSQSPMFRTMANKLNQAMTEVLGTNPDGSPAAPEPAPAAPAAPAPDKPAAPADKPTEAPAQPAQPTEPPSPEALHFSDAKAADWNKLKTWLGEYKTKSLELEKKLAEREKEFTEFKTKAVDSEQLNSVKKEYEEWKQKAEAAQDQLKRFALEQSEEFNGHFQKKFDSALARAKEAAGEHAEKVAHLLSLAPSKWRKAQLEEIAENLGQFDSTLLAQATIEYDTVRAQRDEELKNSKENYSRLTQMRAEKAKLEAEALTREAEIGIARHIEKAKSAFDSFKPIEGNQEQTLFAKESQREFDKFLRGDLDPDRLFAIYPMARNYEMIQPKYEAALKEIEALKQAIKSYEAAKPAATGGPPPGARQGNVYDSSERPFSRKFMEALGQQT